MDSHGHFIKDITIYDSLKRHTRVAKLRVCTHLSVFKFLRLFESFLLKFVLFDTNCKKLDDSELHDNIQYIECPQQQNLSDCSLYALGVLLHVTQGITINSNTFTQDIITTFRQGLLKVLSAPPTRNLPDPKKHLSRQFIISFFPALSMATTKFDPFIVYYNLTKNYNLEKGSTTGEEVEFDSVSEYELPSTTYDDSEDEVVEYKIKFGSPIKDNKKW